MFNSCRSTLLTLLPMKGTKATMGSAYIRMISWNTTTPTAADVNTTNLTQLSHEPVRSLITVLKALPNIIDAIMMMSVSPRSVTRTSSCLTSLGATWTCMLKIELTGIV